MGGEASVTEICSIPLSIGNYYKDQIVCDIIDMDVCHILLGGPWQYDNQTFHKGRDNTCEFMWMGKCVLLLPLGKEEDKKQIKEPSQLFYHHF